MTVNVLIPRPPEFKAISYQVKATDDKRGIIEGFLNVIGNIDEGDDRSMANAFKKTLNDSYAHKSAHSLEYLWPYLWNHDPSEPPIGGIFDADEVKAKGDDPAGLFIKTQLILDIERARNVYSCFKGDTYNTGLLKQSMGYKTIRYEYVNEKGKMIRNLLEVAIWEGSAVVFPMNDLAVVTSVKSKDASKIFTVPELSIQGDNAVLEKSASGKTTWALADRDTKWDSGQASKDIQEYAADGDDLDWKKVAQCFFWVAENPPTKLGDCKLPFVAKVGDKMMAVPQGIISVAGVLQGSMGGVNIPDGDVAGVKAKVAKYYSKMDMTPPWEDKDKMNENKPQRKDFNTLFQATQAADCLEDWGDLVNTLTQAMMELFCMGDQPQADMSAALQQFEEAIGPWTEKAMGCGLANYISDTYGYSSNCYVPYSLRVGGYDAMSRGDKPDIKSGARFSDDTKSALSEHVKSVMDVSKKMQNMSDELAQNAGSLQKKASDLTNLYQSEDQGPAFAEDNDNGKSNSQNIQSEKRREPPPQTLTREKQPPKSTEITIDDLEALLA
jgi:HK97 family phage prohead protease